MTDPSSTPGSRSWRWLRNAVVVIVIVAGAIAILGFFVAPHLAKARIEALAGAETGRQASLGKFAFNPFTLHAKLSDFTLADREPSRTLLSFSTLDVDVALASLWNRAPVIDAVKLVGLRIGLVRNGDGSLNIQDLVDRALAPSEGPVPRFSVSNIEVDQGEISFDDRLRKHVSKVTGIGIGIPFLSSLPRAAKIRVTPHLEGVIDGSRFALNGSSTSPFVDRKEATLAIDLDALKLADYAAYAALPQGLKLTDGVLTTRLKLTFVTAKGVADALELSGSARVDGLALSRNDGSRLASAKSVDASIAGIDLLHRSVTLDRIAIDAPEIDLHRLADGSLEIGNLLSEGPVAAPQAVATRAAAAPRAAVAPHAAVASSAAPAAWKISLAETHIGGGIVHVTDQAVTPTFTDTLSGISVDGRGLSTTGPPGSVDVAFDSAESAHVAMHVSADLARKSARGHLAVTGLPLPRLQPYYASLLNVDLRRGMLDVAGDFDVASGSAAPHLNLSGASLRLADLDAAIRGERDSLLHVAGAEIAGIALDLGKRSVAIDDATWHRGSVNIVREADGSLNFEQLLRAGAHPNSQSEADSRTAAAEDWSVAVHKLRVDGVGADFEDRSTQPPVKLRVADARIALDEIGNTKGIRGHVDASLRAGRNGRLSATGALTALPLGMDLRVDAAAIDVVPFRPYFEPRTNIVVTSGAVSAKGRLRLATADRGGPRVNFSGDVTLADFDSLDRPHSHELLRWKTLALKGIDVKSQPLAIGLGAVSLDQFYARIIVNADGTLNLQRLLAPQAATLPTAPTAAPEAKAATTATLPSSPSAAKALPVSIGRIDVANGEVEYSDFFVKPNYSTHLTGVKGSVSALSASQAGDVAIAAYVEGTAPVDIHGKVNPFAPQLELDLAAKASDVDLPPLTPYAIEYAGYGITKGTLSLAVHYKVDHRKLTATNQLRLDQLTFGEHVDSPSATKLPLLLAVALLKDRNGVINLNLPIEGTLDDPKFSIWGIIVQIVENLIAKAVTAPFALLSSIGGGGTEQLAWVEFAPGHAELSTQAAAKLTTLAKALADRPGLELDASGRAVPDLDRPGLRHTRLDAALRTQKQKALATGGESAPPLESIRIEPAERSKYLGAAYRAASLPDKPKNWLGIAQSIPDAEMEKLLLASYAISDQALTRLANQRAQAVKAWMIGPGHIAASRVFIVAPKLGTQGLTDHGSPTRVDFTIK